MRILMAAMLVAVAGMMAGAGSKAADLPGSGEQKKVVFETKLVPAFKKAMEEGKPMVIVFTADWCEACVKQQQMFERDGVLNPYAGKAIFVKADLEVASEKKHIDRLLSELGIADIPTVVVIDPTTSQLYERGRVKGHFAAKEFSEKFGKIMNSPKVTGKE